MSQRWKDVRTNWMYWRFRHITRNRLRLRNWWNSRSSSLRARRTSLNPGQRSAAQYRPRATSAMVYGHSSHRAWGLLLGMVLALTALSVWANSTYVSPGVVYGIGSLVVVAAVYLGLRGL